jgi:hypothetical protein
MRKNKIHRADVMASLKHDLSIVRILDPASRDPAGQHRGDEVSQVWERVRGGEDYAREL